LQRAAFTLIELLIVIGIIVLLAGMLFTAIPAIQRVKTTSRLKNEMTQIQTAIDAYKAKKGFYPPDNPGNPTTNQLYYELIGTRFTNDTSVSPSGYYFYAIDGSARILTNAMPMVFGTGSTIMGFANCTHGSGDDLVRAENFFKGGLRSGQFFATITTSGGASPSVLGSAIDGPLPQMIGKVNPWRYNSTNPTNNPGTYDLWIDYSFGGKTNRICNWSDRPFQL
jgi:prepilin-type N-terminal cleavage/methylation domain-containing protein